MIIIKINGGLGNQMFQYAFGRAISYKNNYDLFLDLSHSRYENKVKRRPYGLSFFQIKADIANDNELNKIIFDEGVINKNLKFITLWLRGIKPIKIKYELGFEYSKKNFDDSDNRYYIGYWQSEKYFSDISNLLKKEFCLTNQPSKKNNEILKKIKSINSVAIHVRHGDYLHNKITNKFHGVCSKEYYLKSMDYLEENTSIDEYFVFSDDPIWAYNNIHSNKKITIIDWNSQEPHEDLRLMSTCKHHIIANSSFSWWGSWLGSHDNHIVIAPEPWFDDNTIISDDIYLPYWIRIKK